MVLKLDPRFPLVWRSPTSLQVGVASPVVVLDDVTPADERIIAALSAGVSRPGLAMIGRSAGASEPSVDSLLDLLAPALASAAPPAPGTVTITGSGPTVDRIAEALRAAGVVVRIAVDAESAGSGACDLAIAVGHFVLAPELHGLWLRRDIPHLPVVFSDTTVDVGPVVEPGRGACLYCLQRYRTDADPSWPAISAQLWGRRSGAETPLGSSEIAALASRLAIDRLVGGPDASTAVSTEVDVATGARRTREWSPHPLCGCTGIGADAQADGLSAAARRGTDSPGAGPDGTSRPSSSRSLPTTGSASAWPA
jgi:bacteriocin biosynthesis cyclodehydratase domain-containing protein